MFAKLEYNRGQWRAECPNCAFNIIINRAFTEFRCGHLPEGRDLGHGCGFAGAVQWPAFADEIETVCASRPPAAQNWIQGESVADLLIENALYGGA